jgi:hypothetical protein
MLGFVVVMMSRPDFSTAQEGCTPRSKSEGSSGTAEVLIMQEPLMPLPTSAS